ncbi:hypothetical protein TNCV_1022861 [Trichonephila clavipes]|nr:hypothetical protein TNCV_1022861 [Trichonephila clavipes]
MTENWVASSENWRTTVWEVAEELAASPPTNKTILTDDEDNSVVISLPKRSKCYNPPAIRAMYFILAIPE